ncbi:MAG: response regulator [Rhodothermales bacterium]
MQAKILVIDDDELLRRTIRFVLEDRGFQVFEAPDGSEGFDIASEASPDVILLDIRMAEMNGFSTLQAIKGDPLLQHIPIIMMTGMPSELSKKRCKQAGAEYFLTKPFSASHLIDLITMIPVRTKGLRLSSDIQL